MAVVAAKEGKDRKHVGLPGLQPDLLAKLIALGKPIALVLFHGGIIAMPPDLVGAPNLAIVSAGYPGVHGGRASRSTSWRCSLARRRRPSLRTAALAQPAPGRHTAPRCMCAAGAAHRVHC